MALLPVPVIENGMPEMIECDGYWPGDPLPPFINRRQMTLKYDVERDAYLPWVEPPPPPKPTDVGDVLSLVVYGVFMIGLCGLLLAALWWLIIPAAVIAGLVKLVKS